MTAYDQYDNVDTDYDTSTHSADVSPTVTTNLAASVNGCPYSAGSPNPCTPAPAITPAGFASGVATVKVTPYKTDATVTRTVTVKDTAAPQTSTFDGVSPASTVAPGPLHHFTVGAFAPALRAGTESSATVTAYDQYDNVDTDYDTSTHSADVSPTVTTIWRRR